MTRSALFAFFLLNASALICAKKTKNSPYNPDNVLVGVDNQKNDQVYNSQFRIRVRKLDPLFRTVLIKGVEPNFRNDINADGTSPLSENAYSKLPIKLHVPIIPIYNKLEIRRMPVISQNPHRLPLEANERLLSFAIDICKLPSLWYVEIAYCMHRGVTKFTTGILTSYTLQDIVGASLASMELPSESFSLSRCKNSISLFSDVAINNNVSEICSIVLSCLMSKEFSAGNKGRIRKLEMEISKTYGDKPPLFRGQQPRSYAQKVISGLLLARREMGYESGGDSLIKKVDRSRIPDKLFYVIRYFNFIMILTEFLIRSGYKDSDAFEISAKAYLKIGDNSLLQPSPIKMIAKCARQVINAHVKNNSVDYLPFMGKATWCPFSNVIIQHACTELVSMGFINSAIEIPNNISISELEYLAYPHLAHRKANSKKKLSESKSKSKGSKSPGRSAKKKTPGQSNKQLRSSVPKVTSPSSSKKVRVMLNETGTVAQDTNNSSDTATLEPCKSVSNDTQTEQQTQDAGDTDKILKLNMTKQFDDILSSIDID